MDAVPFPPRYRWLKRIMLAAVLSILFLLAIRLAWGWHAHRAFERAIAEIKQRGEPIEPEDFDSAEIPDEENAAPVYQDAVQRLELASDELEFLESAYQLLFWPTASTVWGDTEQQAVRRLEDKYARPLQLIRAARSLRAANWNNKYRSPVEPILLSTAGHRQSIRLLSVLAAAASRRGDHVRAADYIGDAIAYAEHLDKEPALITHLVAIAGLALACHSVEDTLPRVVRMGHPGCHSNHDSECGPREEWQSILRNLLDEAAFARSGPFRIQFDRMFVADTILRVSNGQLRWNFSAPWPEIARQALWERPHMWTLSPVFLTDGRRLIQRYGQLASAIQADDWPSARRIAEQPDVASSAWRKLVAPFSTAAKGASASLLRSMFLHYRALTFRRMAATAVAIRLFQEDHGRRPESLEELVPKYLPAVPLDPMAEGNAPIRYLPHASPPILYSVSENGVDDGGRYLDDNGEYYLNAAPDHPFFLDGRPVFEDSDDDASPDSDDEAEEEGESDGESDIDDTDDDESGQAAPDVDRIEDQHADPGDAQDEDQRPQ